MFDCGNSRTRTIKKNKQYNCNASVVSNTSTEYSVRDKYKTSRKCIESDVLCGLIDDLRYSGRHNLSGNRKPSQKSCKLKSLKEECHKEPSMTFDGGTSKSDYLSGPIIDLGTSSENLKPDVSLCVPVLNTCRAYSGSCDRDQYDSDCEKKVVFDGGNA